MSNLPIPLDQWRDCPRCGGRPARAYIYDRPGQLQHMAYCATCQRTYTQKWRVPAGRKPYVPVPRRPPPTMDERLADYVGSGWRTLEAAFARKHELWIRGEGGRPQWGGNTVVRVRQLIVHRDGGRCLMPLDDGRLCLAPATQVDHITPRSEGGSPFDPDNLRAACMPCNVYAGHMLAASKFGPLRGGQGVAPPQNTPWFLGALG